MLPLHSRGCIRKLHLTVIECSSYYPSLTCHGRCHACSLPFWAQMLCMIQTARGSAWKP